MQDLESTVERCREGDEDAWSELVNTTLRPIYRLCASYAPTAAEAEELTQDVYFKVWENLHRYRRREEDRNHRCVFQEQEEASGNPENAFRLYQDAMCFSQ